MTVGTATPINSYSSINQAQFFTGTVSNDRLSALMKEYGVQPTGNEYNDLQSLYKAMYNYFSQYGTPSASNLSSQPSQAQQAANAPWAPLMKQVGLSATGDLKSDYAAFLAKVSALQGNTSATQSEKTSLQDTEKAATYAFVQPSQMQAQAPQLSGADIVAQLNKAFLVGK